MKLIHISKTSAWHGSSGGGDWDDQVSRLFVQTTAPYTYTQTHTHPKNSKD
jgi:hypothetical protein